MNHREYLNYLREQKRVQSYVQSRSNLDESSVYFKLQQAHNKIYNDYLDREIEREELKVMEEMVSQYLKNMSFDVSLNGEKVTDAIVKEITKGLGR